MEKRLSLQKSLQIYIFLKNKRLSTALFALLKENAFPAYEVQNLSLMPLFLSETKTHIFISEKMRDPELLALQKAYPETTYIQLAQTDKKENELAAIAYSLILGAVQEPIYPQDELKGAAKIHKALLEGRVSKKIPGFSISTISLPSKQINGDFFEFYEPSSDLLDLVISDVMGKGIEAALIGVSIKMRLHSLVKPFYATKLFNKKDFWHEAAPEIEEILTYLHAETADQLSYLEYFATLFYGRFNKAKRVFEFLDLGSTKPIHVSRKTDQASFLEGDNLPLGVRAKETFNKKFVTYEKGDFFIFYSDGITEAKNPAGIAFGRENLRELILENSHLNSKELAEKCKSVLYAFTKSASFEDDFTLLVIHVDEILEEKAAKKTVTFRSCLTQLEVLREHIAHFLHKTPGDTKKLVHQLQLALNEVFCNICKHGYKNDPLKSITIECTLREEGVIFDVLDQGAPFNPDHLMPPNFSGQEASGFGWYITSSLVEEMSYIPKKRESSFNHLRLFKKYLQGARHMEFECAIQGSILVITPKNSSLDAQEATVFKEIVITKIGEANAKGVILNLEHVHFIDSAGLGSLLSILRGVNAKGIDLKLVHLNEEMHTMLKLVKMNRIFDIYDDKEKALAAFGQ
jgi:anti-anti-sigma factor